MSICIEIYSALNYFQFISLGSCTKMPTLSTLCVTGKTRLKHHLQFRFASFRSRQTLLEAHCCMRFIAQIYFPLRAPGAEFNVQNRENCTITSGLSASLVTEGFPLMDDTIMETAAVEGNCCVRLFTGNMHSE